MAKLTPDEIAAILDAHAKWLRAEEGGKQADFSGIDLSNTDFSGAILSWASFDGATLDGASFYGSNCYEASFSGASLCRTDFSRCTLSGASFYGSNCYRADFYEAGLDGATLDGATLSGAVLYRANLSGASLDNIVVAWTSRDLLAEILWRAADGNAAREQLAAWIGRMRDWCWDEWIGIEHPAKQWALAELRKWVKDGDNAPDILRSKEEVGNG